MVVALCRDRCRGHRCGGAHPFFEVGGRFRPPRFGKLTRVHKRNHRRAIVIDAPPIRWAAQHYYGELLQAGVRIWEYQPTMIHAKLLTVDGVWSVVGSANMDVRSQELNEEVILGIRDPEFGRELEQVFLQDVERAKEIRAEEWCRRGWPLRLRSRVCKVLEEQY